MRNPFVAMALVASMLRMFGVRGIQPLQSAVAGHNRRSRYRVAMDKRAARKARNVKRNKQ